jgi:hypothetical protein
MWVRQQEVDPHLSTTSDHSLADSNDPSYEPVGISVLQMFLYQSHRGTYIYLRVLLRFQYL